MPGCGARSECEEVLASRWSRLGALPVSVLAAACYALLAAAAAVDALGISPDRTWPVAIGLIASVLAGGAAIWFTGLQLLVLRKFCNWCMTIHVLGLTGSVIFLEGHLGRQAMGSLALWATSGILLITFIVGQILWRPKLYRVVEESPETGRIPTTVRANVGPDSGVGKSVELAGGRISLEIDAWPVLGSQHARRIVALLFDVSCKDCRRLHGLLAQEVRTAPAELAVILVPVPLNSSCNSAVLIDRPEHAEACAYARMLLALWDVSHESFLEFDAWLLSSSRVPSIHEARGAADELVSSLRRTAAQMSEPVERRLARGVELFRSSGSDQLPQLLLHDRIVIGPVENAEQLGTLLRGSSKIY